MIGPEKGTDKKGDRMVERIEAGDRRRLLRSVSSLAEWFAGKLNLMPLATWELVASNEKTLDGSDDLPRVLIYHLASG
jgi:hypothetical protein